jgi:drug/metabolite transporter (DMT)-like permease
MNDETSLLRPRVLIPFTIVTLIWGSTWLVIRDQVSIVPPSWSVTWRFTAATIGMMAFALVRRENLRLPREGLLIAALVGLTQFCGNFQFVYRAEQYLTSGIVAVLYALLIVPNAVLASIFLRQPINGRFLAGSAVALGGIALLLLHEYHVSPPGGHVVFGVVMTLCGLLSASSAGIIQSTPAGRQQKLVPLIAWAMVFGALFNAAFAWIVAGPPVFDPRPAYVGGVLYLAIFGSVITFPLYFELVRTMGAGRAAYNSVIVPVVAMGLSTLFEGYRWTGLAAGGAVLALAGLVIAMAGRSARSPSR